MQSSADLGGTFSRAWQLLSGNWIIAVPAIIIGVAGGILIEIVSKLFIGGGLVTGNFGAIMLGGLLTVAIATILQILTVGMTTGMGVTAWRTGTADFADGTAVFSNGGAMQTLLLWMAIGVVLAFIPILGWIADVVLMFLLIYAVPAAVATGEGAGAAFSESVNIVTKNFLTTLIIIALIFVIGICGGIAGGILSFVPFLGKIVAEIIQQVILAYGTLVIVGEYFKIRGAVGTASAPPSP